MKIQPFVLTPVANSTAISLNKRFRFCCYQRGHKFKGHYAESYS